MILNENYDDLLEKMKSIDTIGVDCRVDLQSKQLYREAKDARAEARQIERQFYKNEGDNTSDNYWSIVAKHALTLLLDFSRDVEVMSWLLESLCRLDGYRGCTFSFRVITLFLNNFSNRLYPHLDEDDPFEWQWMSLAGLNGDESQGSLIIPLNSVKLCKDPSITLWEYQHLCKSQKNFQALSTQISFTMVEVLEHIKECGSSQLLSLLSDCDDCINSLELMTDILFSKLSNLAPPTGRIKESLDNAKIDIQLLAKQVFGDDVLKNIPVNHSIDSEDSPKEIVHSIALNNISHLNRTKAIQSIQDIALYFQNTEPHSPIPYMLRRVIAWSKLSWPELMHTMVHNKDEIDNIIQQTGMPIE